MIRPRTRPTTQSWLPVRRLDGGALHLRDGSLRAVLECPTLAFGLKGEAEQRAVMQAWSALLNSLPHPLQFLVQTRHLDPTSLTEPAGNTGSPALERLRRSYAELVGRMAVGRQVLAHRFYVVVPVDGADADAETLEQRVRWVSDWLRRIDLEPVRRHGPALASFLYRLLCPETAVAQPLLDEDAVADLPDLIAPAAMVEQPDVIQLSSRRARTLAISRYPKRLLPAWLDSLYAFEGDLDVSLHVQPAPGQAVMRFLERRVAELGSTVRISEERGRRADPYRRAALEDAEQLQDDIARGSERLFDASLYLTIWSDTDQGLETDTRRVEALLGSQLIHSRRALFQAEPGLISSLPLGLDRLGLRRSLSTSALAATFPFTGNDLSQSRGLLYGVNPEVRSPVLVDRFAMENHNAVVFATSGAGKSFAVKTELLRAHVAGLHEQVIDPEGEYAPIVEALGGTVVTMRPGAPVSLDAFAILEDVPGALSARISTLLTLFELLAGGMSAEQRAVAEEALSFVYAAHGHTDEGGNDDLQPPTMAEVETALGRRAERASGGRRSEIEGLTLKLGRYVRGSGRWLFAPAARPAAPGSLVAYVLAGLPEDERAPAMFLVLDRIWSQLASAGARTLVVVDEAWWLMQYPDTARFLYRLAKTARKRRAGLTLVTQDVTDVLDSPLGEPIVTNAAFQVLMKQAPQALERLAKLFQLTPAEQSWLLNARQGEGLILAQGKRVPFQLLASDEETRLIKAGEHREDAA